MQRSNFGMECKERELKKIVEEVPLIISAVLDDNYDEAKTLLEQGAFVDAKDSDGCTALNIAAANANTRIASLLLQHKADPYIRDNNNQNPIDIAFNHPDQDVFKLIQEHEKKRVGAIGASSADKPCVASSLTTSVVYTECKGQEKEDKKKNGETDQLPFIGFADDPNKNCRPTMEDTHAIALMPDYAVFGLYDGHGGKYVADAVAGLLHKNIDKLVIEKKGKTLSVEEWNEVFTQAFKTTDDALDKNDAYDQGSTAVTALITKEGHLAVAWAGDSRAVLVRGQRAIELSQDHKPTRVDELMRIRAVNGIVARGRVGGILAVSRAFGDKYLRQEGVIAVPEIMHQKITKDDKAVVIACDGYWDECSNQEAADVVQKTLGNNPHNYQGAARELVNQAIKRGTTDNVSVFVVGVQELLAKLNGDKK